MGDYAPAEFMVWGIRDENREAVFHIFAGLGFSEDWCERFRPETMHDGMVLTDGTARLDVLTEIGPQLEALGVSYDGSQDAKYEFDGQVRIHFPDLGTYVGTGSQEGSPMVYAHEIEQMIAKTMTREALVDMLRRKTGKLWLDRVEELRAREAAPA